jgi:hypothetical protein
MVKLAEIKIDPAQRTLDYLISNLAVIVEREYTWLSQRSKDFSLSVEDVYSADDLAGEISDASRLLGDVKQKFSPQHQTYKLVVYMLNYLKNS